MWPVILRELQAEARHSFTYWLRVWGAAALLLVGAFFFLFRHGLSIAQGGPLFAGLHVTLFFLIWVAVPLMTSSCISRERREGTLGLLFLTPLTARSIILAKALAHGLRALTPPALRLSLALARWASKNAVDVNRDEAYFRNISLVPHGTPSTSSDVERFGMTLESLVPTLPDSDRLIRSRWL